MRVRFAVFLAIAAISVCGCLGDPALRGAHVSSCPDGASLAAILESEFAVPETREVQETLVLARRPDVLLAHGVAMYSARRLGAPERETRLFGADSLGVAFRIAGFRELDLAALACRLRGESPHTAADSWSFIHAAAKALAPFAGSTYLIGVTAPGASPHPGEALLSHDSTGFPLPSIQGSADRGYGGLVTVWWGHESRVHIVEWRFRLLPDGRLAELHERLLAGQVGMRELDFARR
jgi:hypothetical protein